MPKTVTSNGKFPLKFLSHPNWSGIGAICCFIALPIALTALCLPIYQIYQQPIKRLEIREDEVISFSNTSQADLKGDKPAHIYMITYSLLNTGNLPIAPKDFVDDPAIMTVTPSNIHLIFSIGEIYPIEKRDNTIWSSTNNTDWKCKPFLLNPNRIKQILVEFIPSSEDDNNKDYDPNNAIHWSIDVEGLTDIRYTKASQQGTQPSTSLFITFLDSYDISFKGWSVWIFLALGIVFFVSVTFGWLRKCNNIYPNSYLLTLNITLLLFFSFALAEIIVFLFTYPIESLDWTACVPIVIVYAFYIYFLFHTTKAKLTI